MTNPASYLAHQTRVNTYAKMSASEAEVEELVLPGLVGKKEEQPGKDKADKVTGQRLKEINLGEDSDEDIDTEDEEDVSDRWLLFKLFKLFLPSIPDRVPLPLSCLVLLPSNFTIWNIATVPTIMSHISRIGVSRREV